MSYIFFFVCKGYYYHSFFVFNSLDHVKALVEVSELMEILGVIVYNRQPQSSTP
jgi:hypothetical protein